MTACDKMTRCCHVDATVGVNEAVTTCDKMTRCCHVHATVGVDCYREGAGGNGGAETVRRSLSMLQLSA